MNATNAIEEVHALVLPRQTFGAKVLRFIRRKPLGAAGAVLLLTLIFAAVFAEEIAKFGPNDTDVVNKLKAPSALHYFGTDNLGRDVFSRVVYGARISLQIGVITVGFAQTGSESGWRSANTESMKAAFSEANGGLIRYEDLRDFKAEIVDLDRLVRALAALDEEDVRRAAREARRLGAEAVAICFLHAYLNPDHERRAAAIVRAILSLAQALGMRTTAEGVETKEQLELLRALGCTEMQGYLFSRPKPAAELAHMLSEQAEPLARSVA